MLEKSHKDWLSFRKEINGILRERKSWAIINLWPKIWELICIWVKIYLTKTSTLKSIVSLKQKVRKSTSILKETSNSSEASYQIQFYRTCWKEPQIPSSFSAAVIPTSKPEQK